MRRFVFRFLLRYACALFTLFYMSAQATPILSLNDPLPTNSHIRVLEDDTRVATIDQVRDNPGWRSSQRNVFTFGLSKSVWWLRLSVSNQALETKSYVLDLGTTQQDFVDWYIFDSQSMYPKALGSIGDLRDFRLRTIPARKLAIPLTIKSDETIDIFVRLSTSGTAFSIMKLTIFEKEEFLINENRNDFLVGVFFGGWLLIAITLIAIFVLIRWVPALFLSCFILSILSFFISFLGVDLKYFLPNSPFVHRYLMALGAIASYVMGGLATMQLVNFRIYGSKLQRRMFVLLIATVLSSMYWVFVGEFGIGEATTFLSGIVFVAFVFWVLFSFALRGVAYSLPLSLIYGLMLISLVSYCLHLYNVISFSHYVVNFLQFSAVAVLLIFSVFVAIEIRHQILANGFKRARLAMAQYIAHDIRAPQSSILALLDRDGGGVLQNLKTSIESQVKRTIDLADSFLWLSKAESSIYVFESVFLGDLVYEAIDMAWPLIENKSIIIERVGLDDECAKIFADRAMVTRCLFNLIENAVKYSPPKTTVKFIVKCVSDRVVFVIEDQGDGMSVDMIEEVFVEFRRGKDVMMKEGFGLGLAFVASVLNQHHATIVCHSELGKGTAFTLSFRRNE